MVSKLVLLTLFVFIAIIILFLNNREVASKTLTYLALGDSYTVGEGVAIDQSFPYQTVQLLRKAGLNVNAPEIIARTGRTSDELKEAMKNTYLQNAYSFVSILVGVNDQYRELSIEAYAINFEYLLQQAIILASRKAAHVLVLSIPDWSITPFAADMDREQASEQIQQFNEVNKRIAKQHKATYIDIAGSWEEVATNRKLLAVDGLHPSGRTYAQWAAQLTEAIMKTMV